MKVAIPADGNELDSQVSSVFGHSEWFVVATVEDGTITDSDAVRNEAATRAGGAGSAAARSISAEGVDLVIAESLGENALSELRRNGIGFERSVPGTVRENVERVDIESAGGAATVGTRDDLGPRVFDEPRRRERIPYGYGRGVGGNRPAQRGRGRGGRSGRGNGRRK
jgi:predicted Fe-Mo cluster-binding NifX family protein